MLKGLAEVYSFLLTVNPTQTHTQRHLLLVKPKDMESEVLYRVVVSFLEEYYQIQNRNGVEMWMDGSAIEEALKEDIVSTAIMEALYAGGESQGLMPLCELFCDLLDVDALRPFHIRRGVEGALASLPELAEKLPDAPDMLADMVEDLLERKKITMATVFGMIKSAGENCVAPGTDTALVDSGYGSKVFLRILEKRVQNLGMSLPNGLKEQLIDLDVANLYPASEREGISTRNVLNYLDGSTSR